VQKPTIAGEFPYNAGGSNTDEANANFGSQSALRPRMTVSRFSSANYGCNTFLPY
jgi:hypothetical protein